MTGRHPAVTTRDLPASTVLHLTNATAGEPLKMEGRNLTTEREPTAEIDHLLLAALTARTSLITRDHVLLS